MHSGGESNPKEKTLDVADTSVNNLNEIESTKTPPAPSQLDMRIMK